MFTNIFKGFIFMLVAMWLNVSFAQKFKTPYEKSKGLNTATYDEIIDYYQSLDREFDRLNIIEYGPTDIGKPLHLIVISENREFDPVKIKASGKAVLMILNGIHPGESCGVDASMMFARNLLKNRRTEGLLSNVVVCIVPVYNIGGALHQSCCTRANQQGPENKGFRGNGQNLDLNRDFIKADSRNMQSFAKLFHDWQPDFLIDTHTSDGADYQYVMTLIATQKDKLNPLLGKYMDSELLPELYKSMKRKGEVMTPYVHVKKDIPDNGIKGFLETPRYSTGYAALFNTIGFTAEAHMFKTFAQRVTATYKLLHSLTELLALHADEVIELRKQANEDTKNRNEFPLNWTLDTTHVDSISFLGYEVSRVTSKVTGLPTLFYNRTKPYSKKIAYYNTYMAKETIRKPAAYIIPQAWQKVIERLKWNQVELYRLKKDTLIEVEAYYIVKQEALTFPWEGHYFHTEVDVRKDTQNIRFFSGDYVVFPNQTYNRYIVETLEPTAADAFFRWNFFDAILMQKEYFSGYVFDKTAEKLLAENPELKQQFEKAKKEDESLKNNHRAQLDFIYKRSAYYEKSHLRYPVYRLTENLTWKLELAK
jgi:Zinc carboxypeptidase